MKTPKREWAEHDDPAESAAEAAPATNRRLLLTGAAGGLALAASRLILPAWLEETEARDGALGGDKGGRRGKNHKGRHRKRSHGDKKDKGKPRGGSGSDEQGYAFVGSYTVAQDPFGLAADLSTVAVAAGNGAHVLSLDLEGQLTPLVRLPGSFYKAVAVANDLAAARTYVADILGGVSVYAEDKGDLRRVTEIRRVRDPNGVTVAGPFLFVSSARENNIRTFRIVPPTYEPVATVAGFNNPGQLACDGERLYVADTGNHRVQVYVIDGRTGAATLQRSISIPNPGGIAVGGGQLYVTCASRNGDSRSRVQVFDLDADGAATPAAVVTKGNRAFKDPRGVSLGRGFLLVADTGNSRIQVFRIP